MVIAAVRLLAAFVRRSLPAPFLVTPWRFNKLLTCRSTSSVPSATLKVGAAISKEFPEIKFVAPPVVEIVDPVNLMLPVDVVRLPPPLTPKIIDWFSNLDLVRDKVDPLLIVIVPLPMALVVPSVNARVPPLIVVPPV